MILLFSGGVDSFIAYHWLKRPSTVYFDLKSKYSDAEIATIKKLIPDTIINDSLNLKEREYSTGYIPFRNLYLALLATKYDDEIVIAGIKGDNVSDKNPKIFAEFSKILSKMELRPINVISPFWEMTKDRIVSWYLDEGLPKEDLLDTISCYSGGISNYCGECACCFRKWVAFYNNGIALNFTNPGIMFEYLNRANKGYYIEERNRSIIRAVNAYLRRY